MAHVASLRRIRLLAVWDASSRGGRFAREAVHRLSGQSYQAEARSRQKPAGCKPGTVHVRYSFDRLGGVRPLGRPPPVLHFRRVRRYWTSDWPSHGATQMRGIKLSGVTAAGSRRWSRTQASVREVAEAV